MLVGAASIALGLAVIVLIAACGFFAVWVYNRPQPIVPRTNLTKKRRAKR